jgi:Helix-hairpin-helix motif
LQPGPGIGPAAAGKILQMRKSYGPFKSFDDLVAIRGIGKKRLNKMRKYLTAGWAATPGKSVQPVKQVSPAAQLPSQPLSSLLAPNQKANKKNRACNGGAFICP